MNEYDRLFNNIMHDLMLCQEQDCCNCDYYEYNDCCAMLCKGLIQKINDLLGKKGANNG